ncbi:MAG: hypothetical protein VX792_08290 [Candidatus Latescibacterota bacterium]|nr:hypothetical protein [Candidatus Latescibacterota bacterium]
MMNDTKEISTELRSQLLAFVADRLTAGEPLIAQGHFLKTLEEGYQTIAGESPSEQVLESLGEIADRVLAENAQAYAVPGVENWIIRSLLGTVRKKGWDISAVQENASSELRNFLRQEKVRNVLASLNLTPQEINQKNCLRAVANAVAGKEDPQKKRAAARLAKVKAGAGAGQKSDGQKEGLNRLLSEPVSEPDGEERNAREEQQSKGLAAQRALQMQVLVQNLDAYVERGHISPEDAERLRKLHQVDVGMRSGKIERERGSKIRNSILSGQARDRLDKKVREEVDYVAIYARVFEALGRIDPRYDAALNFIVRHKEIVNSLKGEDVEWRALLDELIEEYDTLHLILELMDRRDPEVRMLAVRLPPYSYIVRRGQDRVERLSIEVDFLAELRSHNNEQILSKLNAPNREERVRLAAAMLSLIGLVTSIFKGTPFRKELRVLRINLIIDEFFRSAEDVEEARERAQQFLRFRLEKLYPDITAEETAEIKQRSEDMIAASEKRAVAERLAARAARQKKSAPEESDSRLSEEERKLGVLLARVLIRTGGGDRMMPYKIMPDPDDPGQFLLARKDSELNTIVPMMRGGKKRFVEKNRQGVWELRSG